MKRVGFINEKKLSMNKFKKFYKTNSTKEMVTHVLE